MYGDERYVRAHHGRYALDGIWTGAGIRGAGCQWDMNVNRQWRASQMCVAQIVGDAV